MARRELERAVVGPKKDGAEESEKLTVRAEAGVHAFRMRPSVVAQPLMKAEEAQVFGVSPMLHRKKALVLCIEQEDEAQHDAEHALIEVILGLFERGAQPVEGAAAITRSSGFKTRDEDFHRLED